MTYDLDCYSLPNLTYKEIKMAKAIPSLLPPTSAATVSTTATPTTAPTSAANLPMPKPQKDAPQKKTSKRSRDSDPAAGQSATPAAATTSATASTSPDQPKDAPRRKKLRTKDNGPFEERRQFTPRWLEEKEVPILLKDSGLVSPMICCALMSGSRLPRDILRYQNLQANILLERICSSFYSLQLGVSELLSRFCGSETTLQDELRQKRVLVRHLRRQLEAERADKWDMISQKVTKIKEESAEFASQLQTKFEKQSREIAEIVALEAVLDTHRTLYEKFLTEKRVSPPGTPDKEKCTSGRKIEQHGEQTKVDKGDRDTIVCRDKD
ncbi:hypothetical protein BVC80_1703g17 [Macleaya cordata]|uniref:Uncharacterized protein n=1 Tax=Macleaya cordata TaxID=56857 RepID=A0A200Q630_MACCD|nr:hypothetical protein BVC80_1703g17 [Macleaya cordata]